MKKQFLPLLSAFVVIFSAIVILLTPLRPQLIFVSPDLKLITTPTPIATQDSWKVYRNEKYGFEFNYPSKMNLVIGPYNHDQVILITDKDELKARSTSDNWIGVFITFSNQKTYKNLNDFINQEVMSEEINSLRAKVATSPRTDLEAAIVTDEIVGGNSDSTPSIYIFKNGKVISIKSNSLIYVELANQIFSSFKFIN